MLWANTAGMAAPYILTTTVIVLSIGYIIILFSSGKMPSLPSMPMTIPPPSTATNTLTQAIGTGLASTNMVNVAPANTASKNIMNSALSKGV